MRRLWGTWLGSRSRTAGGWGSCGVSKSRFRPTVDTEHIGGAVAGSPIGVLRKGRCTSGYYATSHDKTPLEAGWKLVARPSAAILQGSNISSPMGIRCRISERSPTRLLCNLNVPSLATIFRQRSAAQHLQSKSSAGSLRGCLLTVLIHQVSACSSDAPTSLGLQPHHRPSQKALDHHRLTHDKVSAS